MGRLAYKGSTALNLRGGFLSFSKGLYRATALLLAVVLFVCISAVSVSAEITGDDAFNNMQWEVVFDDSIPAFSAATTGQTFMILGDFDGVLVNRPNGDDVEIVVDPYSAKKKDLVEVLGEQYIAIGVTRPGSLVRFVKG